MKMEMAGRRATLVLYILEKFTPGVQPSWNLNARRPSRITFRERLSRARKAKRPGTKSPTYAAKARRSTALTPIAARTIPKNSLSPSVRKRRGWIFFPAMGRKRNISPRISDVRENYIFWSKSDKVPTELGIEHG